jgi:Fe-S cluster biogenesis protein NfuA
VSEALQIGEPLPMLDASAGAAAAAAGEAGDGAARDRVARVEALLEAVEGLSDDRARALATDIAQAMLDMYGEGLDRIVGVLAAHDDGTLARELAGDELVAHLLLLHGLHPVPVEQRVRAALDGVRPYLGSHGGDVELLGVAEGVARLRLHGSCEGCPASAMTLKLAIEEAILAAAPDVERVEAEGVDEPAHAALLQIECSPALAATQADARPAAGVG